MRSNQRRGDGTVRVWKEGSVGIVKVGGGGGAANRGSGRIIRAILGFVITQHSITPVEVEPYPTSSNHQRSSSGHWNSLDFGCQVSESGLGMGSGPPTIMLLL